MTTYLTATQAATRLARSEKTIRRWIKEGRLVAHHPQGRPNLLAISEDDIARLAQELEPYTQPASDQDTSELEQRVAALESRITELESDNLYASGRIERIAVRLDRIEDKVYRSIDTPEPPRAVAERPATRTYTRRAIEPTGLPERLPPGSIQHFEFADRHGVKPRTFLDHIKKGNVTSIPHDKPNRPGETSHWLSPEQQRDALVYWQANKTPFHECIIPACPCHAIVSGHDQEHTSEQQLEQETR